MHVHYSLSLSCTLNKHTIANLLFCKGCVFHSYMCMCRFNRSKQSCIKLWKLKHSTPLKFKMIQLSCHKSSLFGPRYWSCFSITRYNETYEIPPHYSNLLFRGRLHRESIQMSISLQGSRSKEEEMSISLCIPIRKSYPVRHYRRYSCRTREPFISIIKLH